MKKVFSMILALAMIAMPIVCMAEEVVDGGEHLIDLTALIMALIGLIFGVVFYKLLPFLKAKMTDGQLATLAAVCKVLVYAAEQMFVNGKGEEKLNYVLGKLKVFGFKFDAEVLRAYVEAEVKDMNIRMNKA